MKKIGFLSFGHWTPAPHSQTRSAADVLLQSIDLAVEAERLGMDGAYFRVHHFARQLASPFPLLAAIGARTRKIEIGTGVIEQLRKDEAIAEADTLLLTIPNQLGVAYNVHVMEAILTTVAPGLGWR
jgi:alkanesulfonate monooxygenase SsuD/methylene tetrahydromethanopterin reductase-like flavin-dependent oxidoreductase (luciferase family)